MHETLTWYIFNWQYSGSQKFRCSILFTFAREGFIYRDNQYKPKGMGENTWWWSDCHCFIW